MNSTTTKKRCLYDIYAPCDKRKCKREHRCTVFTEQQENLRRYIKEQSICVAYMLFGKCGHVWSMSTPKYKNTHLRLRALKKKFSIAGVAQPHGIPSQNSISTQTDEVPATIESTVNEVIQSVLTIVEKDSEISKDQEISKRDQQIAKLDQEIVRLTKMVTDLQSRIDGFNSTKEQAEKKTIDSTTQTTPTDDVPATIAGVAHYGIPSRIERNIIDSDDDSGPEWGYDDDDNYFSQYVKWRSNLH